MSKPMDWSMPLHPEGHPECPVEVVFRLDGDGACQCRPLDGRNWPGKDDGRVLWFNSYGICPGIPDLTLVNADDPAPADDLATLRAERDALNRRIEEAERGARTEEERVRAALDRVYAGNGYVRRAETPFDDVDLRRLADFARMIADLGGGAEAERLLAPYKQEPGK